MTGYISVICKCMTFLMIFLLKSHAFFIDLIDGNLLISPRKCL